VKHLSSKQILGIKFPVPPLPEQKRIVRVLNQAFAGIATAKATAEKNLQNAGALFESHLYVEHADKAMLGDLVDIKTGRLDANAAIEDGKYPFFTCSREVFAIDTYAFDCEAILLAGNNAVGDFNVKHYNGKFNAYQRTYVITVNEKKRVLYRFLYFQMLKSLKKFKAQSVGVGTKFLKLGDDQGAGNRVAQSRRAEADSFDDGLGAKRDRTPREPLRAEARRAGGVKEVAAAPSLHRPPLESPYASYPHASDQTDQRGSGCARALPRAEVSTRILVEAVAA
jgi:type I restriction enzyme S subunit